jgi:hypothetical protein
MGILSDASASILDAVMQICANPGSTIRMSDVVGIWEHDGYVGY